jgi:hypothetical protein
MQPVANRAAFAGGIPPSTLDGINPSQYALVQEVIKKNPSARLASLYGLRLFDTARVAAGTALPTSEFELFANPVGTPQTELNGTTQYTKSFIDTNMRTTRQLPAGQEAWITSIQARVLISGEQDLTAQTGANLGLANAPGIGDTATAAMNVLATNLAQAAYESIYLRFYYNQTVFEEGPLWAFPARYGVSGYAGGFQLKSESAVADAVGQNEVAVNNGFGFVFQLPIIRHIDSLYQFSVTIQAYNNFVPTRNFRIQTILEGLGAKSVTG